MAVSARNQFNTKVCSDCVIIDIDGRTYVRMGDCIGRRCRRRHRRDEKKLGGGGGDMGETTAAMEDDSLDLEN